MIKIDVISGFLGAGKTTLIKKLFESKKFKEEKIVIIENEFGEIGIDGTFLKDSGVQIKEINAGCICCSLVGDFESSIKELVEKFSPDRIIIEPSGVGKLSDIIGAINKVQGLDLEINILATVVDAAKTKLYLKNFGEFFNNQVKAADTIVVGKVDKVNEEKLQDAVNAIRQVNENANIITTAIADLDGDKILAFLEEKASLREELLEKLQKEHEEESEHEHHHHHHHYDENGVCSCGHHHDDDDDDDDEDEHEHHHHHDEDEDEDECCHHHHHDDDDDGDEDEHEHHHHHHHHHGHDADEIFESWGVETARSYSKEELTKILDTLCDENAGLGIILRSKGIIKASDMNKWYYFDLVAGDYDIREGEPDYTGRLVVIGSKLNEEKIENLFSKKV
ncbi:MAG: GTP-binding protein [Clostridiales bacterium]|nr:GTP-binding protein [Clostridiales bacterium]